MADPQAQKDLAFTVTLALVCLTIGYFIGEVSSTGLFEPSAVNATEAPHTKKSWPNSYDVTVHADSSDEESGAEGDEDDEDTQGDGKELKGFEDAEDEVKLILVVRTDLNMGKGTLCAVCWQTKPVLCRALMLFKMTTNSHFHRQDRCASISRDPCMLQIPPKPCSLRPAAEKMGEGWSDKDCCAGEKRRRAADIASASNEPGTLCKDHPRRRKDTNRSWEHNRTRDTRTEAGC